MVVFGVQRHSQPHPFVVVCLVCAVLGREDQKPSNSGCKKGARRSESSIFVKGARVVTTLYTRLRQVRASNASKFGVDFGAMLFYNRALYII